MASASGVLRSCQNILRACINDINALANQPKYLENRNERSRFAANINKRLENVWRAINQVGGVVENLEHKR
jgi:hypothetical protein